MKIENVPGMVVGVIIAILIISVVAIPIIDSLPATSYSYEENEQFSTRLAYETDPTVEIEVLDASTSSFKIDSTTITYNNAFNIMSPDFTVNYNTASRTTSLMTKESNTTLATGDKISVTSGAWTFTPTSGSTQSGQIDWIVYPDDNGDWARYYNMNVKVSADTTIYVAGVNPGVATGLAEGTVNGEFTQLGYTSGSTMTVTLNKTPIEGGLSYNVDATNGVTLGSGSNVGTSNGTIVAPIKYKVEGNSATSTIIDIIPILLVVSVLMGVVALVVNRTS